jgi:riboflavin kinase, archaea type
MEISGVIQSGAGKGAFFTQVDWVVKQCEQILGYQPFPGTLNVRVNDSDVASLSLLAISTDFELVPDDPAFCAAQVKKVTLNGIPAAVIMPSEDVRIHEDRILEVISSCSLKQTLGLGDGDPVRLSWIDTTATDRQPAKENGRWQMELYKEIYEFAASAGALEGYVYPRQKLEAGSLDNWIRNIVAQYNDLPEEVRGSFQSSFDRTLGRTVQALVPVLGAEHTHIQALTALIAGEMPSSPHDFEKEKQEKAAKYGE